MKEPEKTIKKVYIALGSNIDPEENIKSALNSLSKVLGEIVDSSSIWQSPAVGSDGPDFLNTVVLVNSNLSVNELKNDILRPIEVNLGRERTSDKNAPRTIDLDILIYDDLLLEAELWEQAHLAVPLAEIYPDFYHLELGVSISEIARELQKKTKISSFKNI